MVSPAITLPILLIEKLGLPAAVAVAMTGIAAVLVNSITLDRRTVRHVQG
ncbi:hypothetical protein [Mesorhizobium amorphae]|uniref:Uncharacterized protein n=1 Tax=Mesorhizobium amorphae CCNWGS0123 TaxID=1082933 RepID=G6Y787_9HYPH|nr:hypothetical protein [Mesorhizobium amorphae]EHH12389.1 hypothetical protein MEA186_09015 [Mesorhizobium amorphae CCNWGS0123]GLR40580.1 hypothetical protein GCM10007880_10960 [Mesorhizobium amorphae]